MRSAILSFILFTALSALLPGTPRATEFCVNTDADLQNALSTAESNGEDDVIRVAAGQYKGRLVYESDEGHSITLLGGYTTDCTNRKLDPSNTVFDGGNWGRVLLLANDSGGDITLEGFTLKNSGYGWSSGGGLAGRIISTIEIKGNFFINRNIITGNFHRYTGGLSIGTSSESGPAGNITISNNLISSNASEWNAGGLSARSSATNAKGGDITLINNLFIGNAVFYLAGSAADLETTGHIVLENNIMARNGSSTNDDSSTVALKAGHSTLSHNTITENVDMWGVHAETESDSGIVLFHNNIIWGNGQSGGGDILVSGFNIAESYNNDYSAVSAEWTNESDNIDIDPLFTARENRDFHLSADSPVIDSGTNKFTVLNRDFEGDPRIFGGTPDMGADEYNPFRSPIAKMHWTPVHGELDSISVGSADHVWGVHETGQIFRWDKDHWTRIDGELKQVSVGRDGAVWGVHHDGRIFRRDGDTWTPVPGELDSISVGSADHVWGVHETGQIFRWDKDHWTRIGEELTEVSVGSDGKIHWTHIEGELKQVSAGSDYVELGVDHNGRIYKRHNDKWILLHGELDNISISNIDHRWGVHETGQVFRWDNYKWTRVEGDLKQVSVGSDGTVWGVDHQSRIFKGER